MTRLRDAEPFPLRVEELTTDWLQLALADALGGERLAAFSAELIGAGEGFMGQLARLRLSYRGEAASAPESVIAKFASTRPETREMARDQSAYQREVGFYRDIGHGAGVPVPSCYFAAMKEDTYHFVLLLEDLAPGVPSDQVAGASKATSREVIEQFAKLHAKWWNDDSLQQYPWARWMMQEVPMEQGLALLDESMRQADATGRFDAYPEMRRLMPLLRPLFKLDPAPPFPFALTHGDLRADNIMEPSDEGGRLAVIDWQLAGVGDPVYDVVRWLVQSISIEDRRETEEELLRLYHERLVAAGVRKFSYRKLQGDYKRNLIVVLLMFSMSMDAIDQSTERAQALFHQFYARLDAALVDWEIEKVLRALPYVYPFIKAGIRIRKALGVGR